MIKSDNGTRLFFLVCFLKRLINVHRKENKNLIVQITELIILLMSLSLFRLNKQLQVKKWNPAQSVLNIPLPENLDFQMDFKSV